MKKAVCILIAALLGVSLTNASAQAKPADGAAETAVYTVQGGPVPVEFSYPAQCAIEDEGSIGVDIVTAGIDLEDGTGLILNAEAEYGCTEIYPVLLTVLSSVTDAAAFDEWLNAEWLPGLLP